MHVRFQYVDVVRLKRPLGAFLNLQPLTQLHPTKLVPLASVPAVIVRVGDALRHCPVSIPLVYFRLRR